MWPETSKKGPCCEHDLEDHPEYRAVYRIRYGPVPGTWGGTTEAQREATRHKPGCTDRSPAHKEQVCRPHRDRIRALDAAFKVEARQLRLVGTWEEVA